MWTERLENDGFAVLHGVLNSAEVAGTVAAIEARCAVNAAERRGGKRDILRVLPDLQGIAQHPRVCEIVSAVLGDTAFLVRATLFDKTPAANWRVPWHQDLTIAVDQRMDIQGFGPWSVKNGVVHVQPPSEILERMITVRVHLDACPAANGALRVMPGTHRLGRVDQNSVSQRIDEQRASVCEAGRGDALVMRPLLLHASSSSNQPTHRRVLHFDYANEPLGHGLNWRMRS